MRIFGTVIRVVAVVALVVAAFAISNIVIKAGNEMESITSVAGSTVSEAYYNSYGKFVKGVGYALAAILLALAVIASGLPTIFAQVAQA